MPAKSIGSITFSATVSVGSSWKNWNTSPTCVPRQAARPASDSAPRSAPATRTVARGGPVDAGEQVEQGRLAAARPPDDRHELTRRDVEGELINGDDLAGAQGVGLDDITELDRDSHGVHLRFRSS